MKPSLCVMSCVLMSIATLLTAAEPTISAKDKPEKYKLKYTLSNSGGSQMSIQVKSFLFDKNGEPKNKFFTDRVGSNSSKSMQATVQEGVPFGFEVLILNGQQTIHNHLYVVSPTPTLDDPMTGEKYSDFICPDVEQLDFAYLQGNLIWSVNPKHK